MWDAAQLSRKEAFRRMKRANNIVGDTLIAKFNLPELSSWFQIPRVIMLIDSRHKLLEQPPADMRPEWECEFPSCRLGNDRGRIGQKVSNKTLTGASVKRHEASSTWHSPHSAHTQRFEFRKFNSITIRDRNAEDCRVAGGNMNWLDHTQTIHNHKSLKEISPFGFRSSAYLSFQFAGNTLPLLGRSRKEEKWVARMADINLSWGREGILELIEKRKGAIEMTASEYFHSIRFAFSFIPPLRRRHPINKFPSAETV